MSAAVPRSDCRRESTTAITGNKGHRTKLLRGRFSTARPFRPRRISFRLRSWLISSRASLPRTWLSVEDGLEQLEIDSRESPVIVAKVQFGEIVIAGDVTTAVPGDAIVTPVPGQAQERTPVDGPEWHPRGGFD